tara:strand:+ start:457 stop:603 length:147 start_codon:yes stop_codon:yes gene_type:complete
MTLGRTFCHECKDFKETTGGTKTQDGWVCKVCYEKLKEKWVVDFCKRK